MTPSVFIDGIDAATLGAVVDLKFTRAFGGGEGGGLRDVVFALDLEPLFQHPALRLNAPVEVRHGAESLGEARIVSIDRGTWEIQADGIVRLGEDYECRAADSAPSSLAVGLPLAIGRGLPWVIEAGLTLPTDVPESMQTVSAALNEWCAATGKSWLLDGRVLRVVDAPTLPTLLLEATDNPNSSTDGVVSSVTAKYAGAVDEHGNPALIAYVTETLDDAPKHVERTIDLTGEGALWETDARTRAKAELVGGSQATLMESVAVAEGTLTTAAGHDLSDVLCTVREGQMLRQLDWVNPDGSPGLYRDWVIGGVEWSLDDGLVLTPQGADAATLGGAIIDMRKGIEDAQDAAGEAQETADETKYGLGELDADLTELNTVTLPGVQADLTAAQASISGLNGLFPITSTSISDGAVTTPKMTANSINGDRITANTLHASKIVASSITGDKVQANSIGADRLVANSIGTDRLAANAVTADKIDANAITASKIAAGAIDGKTITGASLIGGSIGITGVLSVNSAGMILNPAAVVVSGGTWNMTGVDLTTTGTVSANRLVTGVGSSGAPANTYMDSAGMLLKSTSSRRYKYDIEDAEIDPTAALQLRSTTHRRFDDPAYDEAAPEVGPLYLSLIAEEAAEVSPWLATYNEAGNPDGINWQSVALYTLEALKSLAARIEVLEAAS